MQKVKVTMSIYGNFNCFVGAERVDSFGAEFDARQWLMGKLDEGHQLSPKSYISAWEIEKHRAYIA